MKRNINRWSLLLLTIIGFWSCQPEEYDLGNMMSKEDLKFSIVSNPEDPNMVILSSETPNAAPLWITPLGRSTRVEDTVKLAFPGEYQFVYGVMSEGGYVAADTFSLEITTTNFDYLKDPMWELLSGGVGNEKVWYLDLDADANLKYFNGPLYYAGLDYGWDNECYGDADCWVWEAGYDGSWMMPAGDYGSMTFSLKGQPSVTVDHNMLGKVETGVYFLDTDAKTLQLTDAGILHGEPNDGNVVDWGKTKVISISENAMQLAVTRDPALSGEGAALLIYNFISKDYAENWTPAGDPDIEVDLGGDSVEDALGTSNSKKWVLSKETPFDWASLTGELLNGFTAVEDYPDWAGYTAADQDGIAPCQVEFFNDGVVKVTDNAGVVTEGTFEVDASTNIVTFNEVTPAFNIGSWVVATTTVDNEWRIVKTQTAGEVVTDIWFGKRDPDKAEYMVFHFVLEGQE
ncbi:hypothetical protein V6R21_04045 [Limibacter armeniacum]|uniref:hypothetical protein n=1 Tax=Limibacter armeniacum TaxID=466084 RepID=UPI002FE5C2EC